jgi:hypothetical protein
MSVSTAHHLLTMVAAVALLGGCAEPAPPDLYEDVDRANETHCCEPWTIPP